MCPSNELPIGVKETETETKSVFSENIEYSMSDQLFNNIVGYNDVKNYSECHYLLKSRFMFC